MSGMKLLDEKRQVYSKMLNILVHNVVHFGQCASFSTFEKLATEVSFNMVSYEPHMILQLPSKLIYI